jgi:hypothetical protein
VLEGSRTYVGLRLDVPERVTLVSTSLGTLRKFGVASTLPEIVNETSLYVEPHIEQNLANFAKKRTERQKTDLHKRLDRLVHTTFVLFNIRSCVHTGTAPTM